jgi:hypothetical protein
MTERECHASISGLCLQLTHGLTLCREGECDEEVMDRAAEAARALATAPPRRARRKPRTGRLGGIPGEAE